MTDTIVKPALCRISDLADGQSRGFDPLREGCDTMFVVRRGTDIFAYRNACPHVQYARMAWRKDEYLNTDQSMIRCSAHGALFSIESGECVAGPCVGEWLTPVPVTVAQDHLWLAGDFAPGRPQRKAGRRPVGGGRGQP